MAVLVVFLILYFSALFALTAYGLIAAGLSAVVPVLSVVISSAITLFFTMFRAGSELFASKDFDLLMSFPVKTRTIVAAKCAVLCVENTLWTFLLMCPMGLVYLVSVDIPPAGHVLWWLGMLFVPLLPTVIAALFGSAILAISSRFRYSQAIGIVLSISVLLLFLIGSMQLTRLETESDILRIGDFALDFSRRQIAVPEMPDLSGLSDLLYGHLSRIYMPADFFSTAVTRADPLSFLGFALLSLIPYALFAQVLSLRYKQIHTALLGRVRRAKYRTRRYALRGVRFSLYKKEIKRLFSSGSYVTNMGFGAVLCLVFSVALCIGGPEQILSRMNVPVSMSSVSPLIPYMLSAMLTMSCTACVSISMEGKNIWLVKSLPLSPAEIYGSKIWVNLTVTLPVSVISSGLFLLRLRPDPAEGILLFLLPVAFSIFSAVLGIVINIRFCRYDWEDEVHLVKQSVPSFLGLFSSMLLSAVLGAMAAFLPVPTVAASGVFLFLLLIGTFALYQKAVNSPLP